MGHTDPRMVVDEILTTIATFGGVDSDGGGIGIRPSGKIIKIPPRQDLQVIPADQRDELIVQAIEVLTQELSDESLKAGLERATAGAAQTSR